MFGEKLAPEEKPLAVLPRLVLRDKNGCFADLWMHYGIGVLEFHDFAPTIQGRVRLKKEEAQWEKDLLESGYTKKIVGDSQYYCPKERVRESLSLLLDVGWEILGPEGQAIQKGIDVREEKGRIAIRGAIRGLIDSKLQMEGVWEGETLYLKRGQMGAALTLLGDPAVCWEESLRRLVEGLKQSPFL